MKKRYELRFKYRLMNPPKYIDDLLADVKKNFPEYIYDQNQGRDSITGFSYSSKRRNELIELLHKYEIEKYIFENDPEIYYTTFNRNEDEPSDYEGASLFMTSSKNMCYDIEQYDGSWVFKKSGFGKFNYFQTDCSPYILVKPEAKKMKGKGMDMPVTIGNDIRLAQNITLSGLNHNYEDVEIAIHEQGVSTAEIVVEDETWIGANVVVLAGVKIGKHAIIAAGSVVTKNIPAYSVAVGNPARVLKKYNPETKIWEKV